MITIEYAMEVIDYLKLKKEKYSDEVAVYGDEFLIGYDQAIRDIEELVDKYESN